MNNPPIPVVTCTIYCKDKFLVIRRHDRAKKFGGLWGFPGGKVEEGETLIRALRREIKEETNLDIADNIYLADTYFYGGSVGVHFIAFTKIQDVICEDGIEFKWLRTLDELKALPRIPGIDFHIVQAERFISKKITPLSFDQLDYTPEKYLN